MTIATLMGTAIILSSLAGPGIRMNPWPWSWIIICIAARQTSKILRQDIVLWSHSKVPTALPLIIGTIVSSLVIGFTIRYLDQDAETLRSGVAHAIGSDKYPAPQGSTLLANPD